MNGSAKLAGIVVAAFAGGAAWLLEPLAARPAADDHPDRATRMVALAEAFDAELATAWAAEGLALAPSIDDAGWLRRLSIDLRGVIPAADEIAAFLRDARPDKRARTIDEFLADRRSAQNFAELFANLLLTGAGEDGDRISRRWITPWIADEWRRGSDLGAIVRQLVAASAEATNPGPAGLAIAYRDTIETWSGVLARTFLGLQIQCAQCHDSPDGRWKQADFNRFTGFLVDLTTSTTQGAMVGAIIVTDAPVETRLHDQLIKAEQAERKRNAANETAGDDDDAATAADDAAPDPSRRALKRLRMQLREPGRSQEWRDGLLAAEEATFEQWLARHPAWTHDTLRAMRGRELPWGTAGHLDGTPWQPVAGVTRRQALAEWMTAPQNPWFAKAMANRAVAHLLGHGVLEPVDDLLGAEDTIAPALLELLAREFTAAGNDLRFLLGALARTRAYAAGPAQAAKRPERLREERWLAAHPVRPLAAEQLIRSLAMARGGEAGGRSKEHDRFVAQLKRTFGEIGGDGRGGNEPNIPQQLHLMNSIDARPSTPLKQGALTAALQGNDRPLAERLRPFWLATLNREPSADELAAIGPLLAPGGAPIGTQIDELWWALVNSAEFHSNR